MKIQFILLLSLCYTCSLTGCAKIRQMTRRDFAVLNDPFLEDSPVGDSKTGQLALAAADSGSASEDGTTGFARVAGSNPAEPAQSQSSSPFQAASRSRTIVPESTAAGLAQIAAGRTQNQQMPTASAAPDSKHMDMAEMSAFMKQQAEASGMTETAKDLEADFEAFAATRREQWKQQVQTMKQAAESEVQQVASQVSALGESAMPSLPDMSFDDGFGMEETAEPLIRQMSGQMSGVAAIARRSVSEVVAEMPNPFEDQTAGQQGSASSPFSDNPIGFDDLTANTEQAFAHSRASVSAAASNVRSAAQNAAGSFDDFAAFADSQLTGKIAAQPTTARQSNPFQELNPPMDSPSPPVGNQSAMGFNGFGTEAGFMDGQNASKATSSSSSKSNLDDQFGFDVGWRPANMERR
ncbi:MAG: hypothetical protein ABJZ55_22175 [Fuerstiella sp.]